MPDRPASGSSSCGGHSRGVSRSSAHWSVARDTVQIPASYLDAPTIGAACGATVSRRHWLSEAVFRPRPKWPRSSCAVVAGAAVSHRLVESRSVMPNPSSAIRIQDARALVRRSSCRLLALGVDAVVDEIRHRRGRS